MDHLHACSHLFRIGEAGLPSAGYLARVSVGLLLKGLLLHRNGSSPAVDHVGTLLDECRSSGVELRIGEAQMELLRRLDEIYGSRYPDPRVAARIRLNDLETFHSLWHAIVDLFPDEMIANLSREDNAG
jgi:HEPN domain-containing protein